MEKVSFDMGCQLKLIVMMAEYKSRVGTLSCSPGEAFYFVTDIRNLKRFVPGGAVSNLKVEQDSCSFDVSMLGTVNVSISDKKIPEKVVYTGQASNVNDFSLAINMSEAENSKTKAVIILRADLNPFMKLMADKPIAQLLESLVKEMEKFHGWQDVKG